MSTPRKIQIIAYVIYLVSLGAIELGEKHNDQYLIGLGSAFAICLIVGGLFVLMAYRPYSTLLSSRFAIVYGIIALAAAAELLSIPFRGNGDEIASTISLFLVFVSLIVSIGDGK